MVRAAKLEEHLDQNRQLTVTVPSEIPAVPVEILIVSKNGKQKESLLRFLDHLTSFPSSSRGSKEMDEAILSERNAWDQ
jgi:hypothetical protein